MPSALPGAARAPPPGPPLDPCPVPPMESCAGAPPSPPPRSLRGTYGENVRPAWQEHCEGDRTGRAQRQRHKFGRTDRREGRSANPTNPPCSWLGRRKLRAWPPSQQLLYLFKPSARCAFASLKSACAKIFNFLYSAVRPKALPCKVRIRAAQTRGLSPCRGPARRLPPGTPDSCCK